MTAPAIAEELAIRKLLETFAIACIRKDTSLWASTWAEEASWKIDALDQPAVGRSNVVAIFERIMPNIAFVSMTSFPADLVVDGDRASGKAYSQELIFPKAGPEKILVGCSHDEYIKRDGRWYFLKRSFETLRRSTLIFDQGTNV